jgi:hypothetical protein
VERCGWNDGQHTAKLSGPAHPGVIGHSPGAYRPLTGPAGV